MSKPEGAGKYRIKNPGPGPVIGDYTTVHQHYYWPKPAALIGLILLCLILLGGGGLGIYGATTGNWPWNPSHGQPTPTSPSKNTHATATAQAQLTATATAMTTPSPHLSIPAWKQNERASFSINPHTVSTNTVAFHERVVRGDLLIVAITQYEGQVLPSGQSGVKDDEKDVYTLIENAIATPDKQQDYVELYYAPNAKGGFTKVTVTISTLQASDGGDANIGIYEFSGLSTAEHHVPKSGSSKSSPFAFSAGLLNTTGNDDMCFAVGVDSGPFDQKISDDKTVSPGTGYTFPPFDWKGQPDQQVEWDGGERFYTEYATAITPGGCNPNFTIHYAASWAIIGAAFKP